MVRNHKLQSFGRTHPISIANSLSETQMANEKAVNKFMYYVLNDGTEPI